MGSLAEGDLTVKATVTEDITGAIADSVNFAVEALRSLVTTINETAVQVAALGPVNVRATAGVLAAVAVGATARVAVAAGAGVRARAGGEPAVGVGGEGRHGVHPRRRATASTRGA